MKRLNRLKGLWALLFILTPLAALGQSATALRLNEVLVINKDNYADHYGEKSPWIEIYNKSAATVNIGGCYLTNDPKNPKKYSIPKGDVQTIIRPGQHVLFWADNEPFHGTFHLNFKFDPTSPNYIALYDSDGHTLIDEVTVPAGQVADVSYGRAIDGKSGWSQLPKVTPSSMNHVADYNQKMETFKEKDRYGVVVTVISMFVVFIALALLYIIFRSIGQTSVKMERKSSAKNDKETSKVETSKEATHGSDEEAVYAAIAMALYESMGGVHDDDSMVITIKDTERASAWASKAQLLRQLPQR